MRDGKRVLNTLYTLCNKSSESNMTSRLVHVTKSRSQTLDFFNKQEWEKEEA